MTINLSEAKAHLGKYVKRAGSGEVITICERNKPLAELRAARSSFVPKKLKLGTAPGIVVPEDFNAPLTDFEKTFYGESTATVPK